MEYLALDDTEQGRGFWVRESKIFEVISSGHVDFIICHPEVFDLTKERIREVCAWENEPLGDEDRAKDKLIKHAISLGWVKIRHYFDPFDFWSIQADNTVKRELQIMSFILWAIDESLLRSNSEAIIKGYQNPCDCRRYKRGNGGIGRYLVEDLK